MGVIKTKYAVTAALFGILELLGALGCILCTFFFTSKADDGQLYSKYYHTSQTRKVIMDASNYWWGGVPFLLPGILGLATLFKKHVVVMLFFMLANLISFFCAIALAIVVGIFHVLFSIPVRAYKDGRCTFTFNERQQAIKRTYCECIIKGEDISTLDADRMRVYVQSCLEIDEMNTMLLTIIALSCATGFIALICSYIGCLGLAQQDSDYPPRGKKAYNPAPFIQTQHPYNPLPKQQQPSLQQPPPQQKQPPVAYQPPSKPQRPKQPEMYRPPPYQSQSQPTAAPMKQPPREQKPVADEPVGGDWL